MNVPAQSRPTHGNALIALPPMGGVLGAAYIWRVRAGEDAPSSARRHVSRLLVIWGLAAPVIRQVGLVVEDLIAGAAAPGSSPVMLEIARRRGRIAVAVHDVTPGLGTDAAERIGRRGMDLTRTLAHGLSLVPAPGGRGMAVVAKLTDMFPADTAPAVPTSSPEQVR
ncbi:ATP-binding protein [Streptomyces werraensis]|uniref:ATP-binding protein n=1 Tax=Streptomyces werraensis TaxID=68284 RepID=UPI001CE35701